MKSNKQRYADAMRLSSLNKHSNGNESISMIAHLATDCINDVSKLAILAREYDTNSIASMVLLDILKCIQKFTKAVREL